MRVRLAHMQYSQMLNLFEYRGVLQCAAMSFANTKLDGANGRALAPLSDGAKSMPPRYYSHVNEKSVFVCITYGGWNLCGESRLGNIGERLLHIETLYRNPSIQLKRRFVLCVFKSMKTYQHRCGSVF